MLWTLAALSGFEHGPDILLGGARPDVVLLRARDGAMFVGDGKATETPGNAETCQRLGHYSDHMTIWVESGRVGILALAVDIVDAYGWLRVLRSISIGPSGGRRLPGHVDIIDSATAVIWQRFAGLAV